MAYVVATILKLGLLKRSDLSTVYLLSDPADRLHLRLCP